MESCMDGRWHMIALIIAFVIYFLHNKLLTMRKKSIQNYINKNFMFMGPQQVLFYNTLAKTSHSYVQRWTKYFLQMPISKNIW